MVDPVRWPCEGIGNGPLLLCNCVLSVVYIYDRPRYPDLKFFTETLTPPLKWG